MTGTVPPVFSARSARHGARLRLVALAGAAALAVPVGLVSLAAPASAATSGVTRYVSSTNGSDGTAGSPNDCTDPAHPCKTLAHAVDVSRAGDTIQLVGDGTPYQGGVDIDHDLTITGAGQSSTTIDGGGIAIDDANVTITGVDVSCEGDRVDGIHVVASQSTSALDLEHSTVQGCENGVEVEGAAASATLVDDTVQNNTSEPPSPVLGVGLLVRGGTATVSGGSTLTGNFTGILVLGQGAPGSSDPLTVTDATISGNAFAGLVAYSASASVTGTTVTDNGRTGPVSVTFPRNAGIDIGLGGQLTLTDSHVDRNGGTGVYAYAASVDATSSTFDHNHTVTDSTGERDGGTGVSFAGLLGSATLALDSSSVSGNDSAGVFLYGQATLAGDTLAGNGLSYDASLDGVPPAGLVVIGGGTTSVTDSTLSGNRVGLSDEFEFGSDAARPSSMRANASPANPLRHAGPLLAGNGTSPKLLATVRQSKELPAQTEPSGQLVAVINSTISGNSFLGADVENFSNLLALVRSTVSDNGGGPPPGAMLGHTSGGIKAEASGTAIVAASVVAGNADSGAADYDCSNGTADHQAGVRVATGRIVDGGYDVIGTQDHCGFTGGTNGDRVIGTADPGLKPLGTYPAGAPTQTQPPASAASPVVNRIPVDATSQRSPLNLCKPGSTDQRGVTRPQGGKCDVGAAELKATANLSVDVTGDANLNQGGRQSSRRGNGLVSYTVTVRNSGPDAAQNVTLSDVLPTTATGPRGRAVLAEFVSDNGNCSGTPRPYTASHGQTATCDLGTIPAGKSKSVTFTFALFSRSRARSPYPFTFTDSASVSSPTGGVHGSDSATLTYRMR